MSQMVPVVQFPLSVMYLRSALKLSWHTPQATTLRQALYQTNPNHLCVCACVTHESHMVNDPRERMDNSKQNLRRQGEQKV